MLAAGQDCSITLTAHGSQPPHTQAQPAVGSASRMTQEKRNVSPRPGQGCADGFEARRGSGTWDNSHAHQLGCFLLCKEEMFAAGSQRSALRPRELSRELRDSLWGKQRQRLHAWRQQTLLHPDCSAVQLQTHDSCTEHGLRPSPGCAQHQAGVIVSRKPPGEDCSKLCPGLKGFQRWWLSTLSSSPAAGGCGSPRSADSPEPSPASGCNTQSRSNCADLVSVGVDGHAGCTHPAPRSHLCRNVFLCPGVGDPRRCIIHLQTLSIQHSHSLFPARPAAHGAEDPLRLYPLVPNVTLPSTSCSTQSTTTALGSSPQPSAGKQPHRNFHPPRNVLLPNQIYIGQGGAAAKLLAPFLDQPHPCVLPSFIPCLGSSAEIAEG